MTPETYQRAKTLFQQACDLPADQRSAFLEQACAQDAALRRDVERLLECSARTFHPIDTPVMNGGLGISQEQLLALLDEAPHQPEQIGPYRILGKLGEGGMSVVWEAEQVNPRRMVALKVIRPSMMSPQARRRFQYEGQVLGRLQHPGITQIYEAHSAEDDDDKSLPYIVMERIAGRPLTEYADAHGLDVRQRVGLMVKVCEAVQYAHRQGLIHRDLKPKNILVTEDGQPKLLDFGVARELRVDPERTTMRAERDVLVGTLSYMSPEQLDAKPENVDARTDVYSLGVVLYELLAGRPPVDLRSASLGEAFQRVHEQEPVALEKVNKACGRDLGRIVSKALEKDPDQRYQSVSQLSDDLVRYLHGQPITAHPPSSLYQIKKLVQRHKLATALGSAAVVALVASCAAITVLYFRAEHQSETARRTAQFLMNTFRLMHTDRVGPTVSIRKVLDDAAARIDAELAGQPEVSAGLREMVARGYYSVTAYDESMEQFERALAETAEVYGPDSLEAARVHKQIADVYYTMRRNDEAERHYRIILDANNRYQGPRCADNGEILGQLGRLAMRRGDLAAAGSLLEEAREIMLETCGPESPAATGSAVRLAELRLRQRQYEKAEKLLGEVIAFLRAQGGGKDNTLPQALEVLARVRERQGRVDEAVKLWREVLGIYTSKFGEGSEWTLAAVEHLAELLVRTDRVEEAEAVLRLTLARGRAGKIPLGRERVALAAGLVHLLNDRGADTEAAEEARVALAEYKAAGLSDPALRAELLAALGRALLSRRQFADAEATLLDARALLSGEDGSATDLNLKQVVLSDLVDLYEAWGKPTQAEQCRALLTSGADGTE